MYRNYYGAMMSLCLRYTKNESDALDVLNTGFLKVFQNIQRYDSGKGSLYTWIRTVVVRCCLDFIKQKEKEEAHREIEEAVDIQTEADAISQLEAAQLLHLVRQLTPSTQAVFNLYVIEGYNHKEIGQLLTISEGTSKWHLSEARKKLQQMITSKEVKV